MKKLREWWNSNRVLFILSTIVIICLVIIIVVCAQLFIGKSSSSYGNRLEDIADTPLKDEDKDKIISTIKTGNEAIITDVDVHTQGKIIYIRITFTGTNLDKAKEVATSSLAVISEDYQKLYDVEYIVTQVQTDNLAGFTIMGAKNIGRSAIIWNNNTPVTTN